MKGILAICFVLSIAVSGIDSRLHCKLPQPDIPKDWITMVDPCLKKMSDQVQQELTAAMTYMAMGAHFSRDTVNRQGFANYFFKSASEERDHAIKIIDYMLMRGALTQDINKLINNPKPVQTSWDSAFSAIKDALKLETRVTNMIRDIIMTCESPATDNGDIFNDYHLVDYLSGDFLDEQHKGQRELAGMASVLGKMVEHHGNIGEFLYDKELLEKQS